MDKILSKFTERHNPPYRKATTPATRAYSEPSGTQLAKYEKQTSVSASTFTEAGNVGLFEFSEKQLPKTVDAVAVHGLQGHAYKTWQHENGSIWLRDFLPADVPFARILTFGYESTVAFSNSVAELEDKALDLLNRLSAERKSDGSVQDKRPIVFICHSLGGIIVKKALIIAHERSSDPDFQDLVTSTRGIAFIGVPHAGSSSALWANFAANVLKTASIGMSTNTALVSALQRDSSTLSNITKNSVDRLKDLKIYTFYETRKYHSTLVVDKLSAKIGVPNERLFPVDEDHRSICRIPSAESQAYKTLGFYVANLIKEVVLERTPARTEEQPPVEKKRYFHIPDSHETHFIGRTAELNSMRRHLTAENSISKRLLVIWGIGGSGKTQLAFHYARQYKQEFSAAFWVNAKDTVSIRNDYADIARKLKLPEATGIIPEKLVESTGQDIAIQAVKDWFTDHEGGDWLLIIDNADNLEEVDLREYIPPTKKGHVIITSQDKQATAFGTSIELGTMEAEDAKRLFLNRAGISRPTLEQDSECTELVASLGCLALAVEHAAAHIQLQTMSLRQYMENLEKNRRYWLEKSPKVSFHKQSVFATVKTACDVLLERNQSALYLLTFLGGLDGANITETLLLDRKRAPLLKQWNVVTSIEDYYSNLEALLSFSLIRVELDDQSTRIISLHSLVHSCIHIRLNSQEWQWTWLHRSSAFLTNAECGQFPSVSVFPHVRYVLKVAAARLENPANGLPSGNLWSHLVWLMEAYLLVWSLTGNMRELGNYSKIAMNALMDAEDEYDRVMLVRVASLYARVVQCCDNSDTPQSVVRDFMFLQMTPSATAFLKQAHDEPNKRSTLGGFKPRSLVDVFKYTNPPLYLETLKESLYMAAIIHFGQNKLQLGTIYYSLSQLPVADTWTAWMRSLPSPTSLLSFGFNNPTKRMDLASWPDVVANDHSSGHVDSKLDLLRRIISRATEHNIVAYDAICDYTKLQRRLGRHVEAANAIRKVFDNVKSSSQNDIARNLGNLYGWVHKAYVSTMGHEHHEEAKKILEETYQVAKEVYGDPSLHTMHASFLLQDFYSQRCCYSANTVVENDQRILEVFGKIYGGRAKLRSLEGLVAGKTNLAQGSLEEAVSIFRTFTLLAAQEFGSDDPITKRGRRLLARAVDEKKRELKDEEEGVADLKFGCFTFLRDMSTLEEDFIPDD